METRRNFIRQLTGGAVIISMPALLSFAKDKNIPVRAITK